MVMALCLLLASPAYAVDVTYSTILPDLPLMQGMTEQASDAVVFDKASGRIVELTAISTSSPADILAFYQKTLPPLGWQMQGSGTFVREQEKLVISFDSNNVTHFSISPKGA